MPAESVEDHRLELPHIAGKIIGTEKGVELVRKTRLGFAQRGDGLVKKMIDQKWTVFQSLTQRGEVDVMGTEAIVEVLSKTTSFLPGTQIGVCRGDDPCRRSVSDIGAKGIVLLLLEQPEQLYLGAHLQVPYLIKKEGSVGSALDQSLSHGVSPCKGSPGMSEKSIGEDRIVETRHIDRNVLSGWPAELMNRASGKLLSRAALPCDQYRLWAAGHSLYILENRSHRFAVCHDL